MTRKKDKITGLTEYQEAFCQAYVGEAKGNASKAYRMVYKSDTMKMETINRNAKKLMDNDKILTRIADLNAKIESKKIASAQEIQETLTALLRGEINEECVVVEGIGNGESEAKIVNKQVTPKDRIKAGELLAKIRGVFNINITANDVPIIKDDI